MDKFVAYMGRVTMNKPLFSGFIICLDCRKKHKAKLARKKRIYICSTYDNKGKEYCNRNKVDETEILNLLQMRFKGKEILEILPEIELIEVNQEKIIINLKSQEPIISTPTFIQF